MMKQVSYQEFYEFIADKNAKCYVEGDYPYTSIWKDDFDIIAKNVERYPDNGFYPIVNEYYIKVI